MAAWWGRSGVVWLMEDLTLCIGEYIAEKQRSVCLFICNLSFLTQGLTTGCYFFLSTVVRYDF